MKYQTLIMTKNQELQFRAFMQRNLSENPEVTIIAFNEYRYDFKKLSNTEFIKIQKWESENMNYDNLRKRSELLKQQVPEVENRIKKLISSLWENTCSN